MLQRPIETTPFLGSHHARLPEQWLGSPNYGSSAMRANPPDEIAATRTSKSASTRPTSQTVKQMVAHKRKLCHKGHRLELNQAYLCRGFPENQP